MKTHPIQKIIQSNNLFQSLGLLIWFVFTLTASAQTNLTLNFSSPATNSAPGATFSGTASFAPTNSTLTLTRTAGSSFTPLPGLGINAAKTIATINAGVDTNESGTASYELKSVVGSTTNIVTFDVVFLPYPPEFVSGIADITMDEDTTNVLSFVINDPDSAESSLTLDVTSTNTTLVTTNELALSGTTSNRTLTVTPRPNENGSSLLEVTVTDPDNLSVTTNINLTVTPVPDPSTISNAVDVFFSDDVISTNIFTAVVIDDVDHNRPNSEDLILTVTLGSDQYVRFIGGGTTFTTTAVPADVTSAIQNVSVVPELFRGIPGTVNTETATIRVEGSSDGLVVTTNVTLNITVINNPPRFQSLISPTNVIESQSIQPFELVFISDPDLGDDTFTLTLEFADTNQTSLGSFIPTNRIVDNASGLTNTLKNFLFEANSGILTSISESVGIIFSLTDGYGGTTTETNFMQILQTQTPPSISGIPAAPINKTDGSPSFIPLPTVFIQDTDENTNQTVSAVLSASDPSLGTLSATNFPLQSQTALWTALRAVTYTPTAGVLPIGTSADSIISVIVTDALGISATNNNLRLRISSVNNAPQILNLPPATSQPLILPPDDPIRPFEHVGLLSDDTNDVFFSISIDDEAKGDLVNVGGFLETSPGVYEITDDVSTVVSAITNIQFVLNPSYLFPIDDPGGTTFTLLAQDFALLTQSQTLSVQIQAQPRSHLVTRTLNDGLPGSFTYALAEANNSDHIVFALPAYPQVIRLPGTTSTLIDKNLVIKGPGADLLTISGDSNGDHIPDRQLFRIAANVTLEGLTLTHGTAAFGGAIQVQQNGFLTLRQSAIVDSVAEQYGGGIDVDGGRLTVVQCLIARNSLSVDTGLSGGGISAYTDKEIRISNTTFAQNSQPNETGDGGGALVVQNSTNTTTMTTFLSHNTFAENTDDIGRASAVLAVGARTVIRPDNSIFGDFSGRNVDVNGAADFQSQGGNICDDSSRTSLIQEGQSEAVVLLDSVSDLTHTSPLLSPLNLSGNPTPFYTPLPGSPAIDKGISSPKVGDQRGVLRTDTPDTGAIESDSQARLVINEIQFDDSPVDFVEIIARRDSTPVDVSDLSLYLNGVKIHDFDTSTIIGTNDLFNLGDSVSTIIEPGFGIIVALTTNSISLTSASNSTPVVKANGTAGVPLELRNQGHLAIASDPGIEMVTEQRWQGIYVDPVTGTNDLNIATESISLAPQFRGFSLVPHSFILPGPFDGVDPTVPPGTNPSSPGGETTGTPFGQDNAEPLALTDGLTVTEDQVEAFDLLANDFDGDGNDRLFIVDISQHSDADTGDVAITNSLLGSRISVLPTNSPLLGNGVMYDPRVSTNLQQLAEGVERVDSFFYEILDYGSDTIVQYSAISTNTQVRSLNHRLTTNEIVEISGSSVMDYNQVFSVTPIDEDHFSIPVPFVGNPATTGTWLAQSTRTPTSRSEAPVSITVVGVNDYPVANPDVVTNVTEASVVRVMTRTNLAGTVLVFPTDPVPPPTPLVADLVSNDTDIDTDDDSTTLRVIGVLPSVTPIQNYTGNPDNLPVSVTSTNHGLSSGQEILISGYGGSPTYNGYHMITVVDQDTFTLPVRYRDNDLQKGMWAVLNDSNRFFAVTDVGAEVTLTLRADSTEDHFIYDATTSSFLNGLQEDELYTNLFFYAVEDSNGAVSLGEIRVVVRGLNDSPTPSPDPGSVETLDPLVTSSNNLEQVLETGIDLEFVLPPASGGTNRTDLYVLDPSSTITGLIQIADIWFTDEETAIPILYDDLLANDGDLDRLDVLSISSIDSVSREGALLTDNGTSLTYDPSVSTNLNALRRDELIVDTFEVVVTDMMPAGTVTSLVAVLVQGLNDTPIAVLDNTVTSEDDVLTLNPMEYPATNSALHDIEYDQDGRLPDDNLRMLVDTNLITGADAEVDIEEFLATYDPTVSDFLNQLADWQSHTDRFSYTISDYSFIFAEDDEFRIPSGSTGMVLEVMSNDRDYTGVTGTPVIVNVGPSLHGGSVSITTNSTALLFTPAAGFTGNDYFTYTIENSAGDSDEALVLVRSEVSRLNGSLKLADDRFKIAAGETVDLNVLANDDVLPAEGENLTVLEIVSSNYSDQPVLTNGTVRFTATNGLTQLSFRYKASGGGPSAAEANVIVDVIERRGTLDVNDDFASVLAESIGNTIDVLSNDALLTDSIDDLFISQIISAPTHGVVTTNTTGTALIYTPDTGFVGTDKITYLANDGIGGTGTGQLEVVVGRLEVNNDFFYVASSTNGTNITIDVLSNDRLLNNPIGSLSITGLRPASGILPQGVLSVATNGQSLVFAPTHVTGIAEYGYVVQDSGTSPRVETGLVTIVVSDGGTFANPDRFTVRGDSSDNIFDVLQNDISIPDVNKTYSILGISTNAGAPSAGGLATVVSNQIVYTPQAGFTGIETFTYEITDSESTDTATVTVNVKPGDLIANADRFTAFYELRADTNTAVSFMLPVLSNDRLEPALSQIFSITGVGIDDTNQTNSPSEDGLVEISADGQSLIYTPVAVPVSNFVERFTYVISDGGIRLEEGQVEVLVLNRTNALTSLTSDDVYTVQRGSSLNPIPVLENDFILPGNAVTWTITSVSTSAVGGMVTISGSEVLYTPPAEFVGTDTITVNVSDPFGGSGSEVIEIHVDCLPVMPDRFVVLSGTSDNELDVTANDPIDASWRGEYTLQAVFGADQGGLVSLSPSNAVLYTPVAGPSYPYVEKFNYTVEDDTGNLTTGTVAVAVHEEGSDRSTTNVVVLVEGRNDQPFIDNPALNLPITDKQSGLPFADIDVTEVDEQLQEVIDVTVTIDDPEKGIFRNLGLFTQIAPGTYQVTNITASVADLNLRALVFDPTENRITVPTNEVTFFSVTVTDNKSAPVVDTNSFIDVTAVNDAPVISGTIPDIEVHYLSSVKLFSSVLIEEVDDLTLQPLDVSITVSSATNGLLTNLGSFINSGGGVYTATGITAQAASTQLRDMEFQSTTNGNWDMLLTQFDLSVEDGFAAPVTDSDTTVTAHRGIFGGFQPTQAASAGAFGLAVDINDEFAVVGAPNSSFNGTNSGSVVLYIRDDNQTPIWQEFKTLSTPDVTAHDRFGRSVAVENDILVIGAVGDAPGGTNSGSVTIFEQHLGGTNNWGRVTRLFPATQNAGSQYGYSVALQDNTLVVGSPLYRENGTTNGAIFIYERNSGGSNNWGLIEKIVPTNGVATAGGFGWSGSLSGNDLIVGAPLVNLDVDPEPEGAAFIYTKMSGGTNTWTLSQFIGGPELNNTEFFGWDVTLQDNTAIVGAPLSEFTAKPETGAAYVYSRLSSTGTWSNVARLTEIASEATRYGNSLELTKDLLLVGAPESIFSENVGEAFLYRAVSSTNGVHWVKIDSLARPQGSHAGLFGTALALDDNFGIIGAPADLSLVSNEGYVFMYRFRYNNAPVLANPIVDQQAIVNDPFGYDIPENTFIDPDPNDEIALSAQFTTNSLGLSINSLSITGVTTAVGLSPVAVTATDSCGLSATSEFAIIVYDASSFPLTPRTEWDIQNFGPLATNTAGSGISGGDDNPDNDGGDNDTEYAFGGDPNQSDTSNITLEMNVNGDLVIEYQRRTNDPALTYRLQGADDIGNWEDLSFIQISEMISPAGINFEIVRATIQVDQNDQRKFYRIIARF